MKGIILILASGFKETHRLLKQRMPWSLPLRSGKPVPPKMSRTEH